METQLQTQSAAVQDNNQPPPPPQLRCPRCDSSNTKFCYYNNYSLSQPRHFCKSCKRYWTRGGTLRNVPVGGGCRKNKRLKHHRPNSAAVPQLQQQNPSCHVIRPDGNITLNINSNSNSSSNNNSINPLLYGLPGNHAPPAHLGSDGLGYQGIISPSMATLLASTLNGNKFSSNGAVKAETAANLQFQALAGFEQGQDWNSVNNNNNNNNNLGWGQMIGDHNVNYLHHHHHQMEQIGSGQDWAGLWCDPGSSIGPSVTSLI